VAKRWSADFPPIIPVFFMGEVMRHALAILIAAFSMSIGANRLCAETINIVATKLRAARLSLGTV
jgi:hypothetical protein